MSEDFITLTFPDGVKKKFPTPVTGLDVAKSISNSLARNALSVTVNGEILDLDQPIEENGSISINTFETEDGQYTFWHSSAHLLAEAVQELYPEAKFGIGPPIENGFYYDIDFGDKSIGPDDLAAIEKKFLEKARNKNTFERKDISKNEALE